MIGEMPIVMRTALIVVLLPIPCFVGCGGDEFPLAPVSGTITLDGEPLADANVGFEPFASKDGNRAGPGSYATTDAGGHFELESLHGPKGAVVGEHRVSIVASRGNANSEDAMTDTGNEIVPPRYNSASELTFSVPESGTDQANFDLTSS